MKREPDLLQAARSPVQPAEQLRYARALDWGGRIGLAMLVATFVAYASGLLAPHVPLEQLPSLWQLPVDRYRALTGSPAGWDWLALADRGDVATLLGIAVLAGCSIVCLAALLPLYLARGDRAYVVLCLAEVGVLLVAASGVLTAAH
ncbi:MAG TPA: hypothetical protein VFZ93_06020 [Albitalea sp.]